MHELGIPQDIVELVAARAADAHVGRVTLEIGKLSAIMPEAIRFCFDICARGTVVEGAALEIIDVAGRGRCHDCGREQAMDDWLARCACGAYGLECITGEELKIKSMEVV
ncbi:MAG: hydrogenase maturation nickel metallochaperone HypA [Burkholderiaceae bacterium]